MCVIHVASFSFVRAPLGHYSLEVFYLTYISLCREMTTCACDCSFIYVHLYGACMCIRDPAAHTDGLYHRFVSICVYQSATLCVDVKQGGREIGCSSLVAGNWGDLFFGSFPVKFPGDQDTENIYLYAHYVLHKRECTTERREKEKGRACEDICVFVRDKKEREGG